MSLVDTTKLFVKAGNGGRGFVSFCREKFRPLGGPDGGDGGKGGDIIIVADPNEQSLINTQLKEKLTAGHGAPGSKKNKNGKKGNSITFKVPVGTLIYDENNNLLADLKEKGNSFLLAKGGIGGKGNQHFATSKKQTPQYSQPGLPGEERFVFLELRLIAQIGLIGLPNAGKSSLLRALSQSKAKIGNYPFTTLTPNLGILRLLKQDVTIADIPGLIEGASKGQGLGNDFLRHISRTKILLHVIDIASFDTPETIFENYSKIIHELNESCYDILDKPMFVVLNKCDASDIIEETIRYFKSKSINTYPVSALSKEGIETLKESINKFLESKS